MKLIQKLIDTIFVHLGKKALKDIEQSSLDPRKANEELLLKILKENKDTEYGKKYGFKDIHSIEEYRQKVPFSNYDTYEPYISRMIKNKEKNLITAYDVIQYAETSGSVGVQKKIPVTLNSMHVYEKYSFARTKAIADKYYREKYHKHVPWQKGLNMLETETTLMDDGTPRGSVTGAVSRKFRKLFKIFLTSPDEVLFPIGGMNMNYMKARFALEEPGLVWILTGFMTNIVDMLNYIKKNWQMICDDIEKGELNSEVCSEKSRKTMMKYVKKNPKRAAELRKIFEEGFDKPIIQKIWPDFAWACAIGTGGFVTYTEKFKKYAGDNVAIDYFVYAASEGMFAACIDMNDPRFIPLTDSCFFEFLPADADDEDNNTLTLDQLEQGKEYEVIITNQCGFYRYKIRDVIRVLGFHNKCPLITFAYRKGQLVNVAAEKTTEEHLNEAVRRFGKEIGANFTDYALYIDTEPTISRYVMLLEPEAPVPLDKDGSYGKLFNDILSDVNPEYGFFANKRKSIDTPLILIQQQETHALWREYKLMKGSSANQVKPVRVLDVPIKQKFFLGLVEEGQQVPNWNVYTKKKIK